MIDNVDFRELEAEKYWSFPKSYKKDSKAETRNMIFSGDYLGARKMDGAYYRFVKDDDGSMVLQGRSRGVSGSFLDKIGHVPHLMNFFDSLPNGTCLLGELYFPKKEGSSKVTTIMGCKEEKAIDRQQKGDKLHYYIFDIWAWGGFSLLKETAECRFKNVTALNESYSHPYVEAAIYYDGEKLWKELEEVLVTGGEGIVITKKNTYPEPGKRTARKTLKIKKEIKETIDCFFTGRASAPTRLYTGKEITSWKYWENARTGEKLELGKIIRIEYDEQTKKEIKISEGYDRYVNGSETIEPVTKPYFFEWAGSLEIGVIKGEKVHPIGFISGLPDEIKSNWEEYKGKVIEITCMEVLPTGGLRHAKMVQFRDDLSIKDATWGKIFGEE